MKNSLKVLCAVLVIGTLTSRADLDNVSDVAEAEMSEGQVFFNEKVLPKLSTPYSISGGTARKCADCHKPGGSINPGILVYETARELLQKPKGSTATTNRYFVKMAGEKHRNYCSIQAQETEPCKTVVEWFEVEFGK